MRTSDFKMDLLQQETISPEISKTQETPGWFKAFQNLTTEYSFESLRIEGTLPEDLNGTLYRVGPGQFTAFGKRLPHWFDGDGAIIALQLNKGKASAAARNIVTQGTVAELKAGRHFLGSYGMPATSILDRLKGAFRNPGNTSLLSWNGKLLALWEGGFPIEISPKDLSTLGETDLNGAIEKVFSAHPRYVPARKAHYNFGIRYSAMPKIDFFELGDNGVARTICTLPFSMRSMAHDLIATENYLIMIAPPVYVDPIAMLIQGKPVHESMTWKPHQGTEILIVPIDQPTQAIRIQTDAFLPVHFFNGYEKDGKIIIDGICYPDTSCLKRVDEMGKGKLVQSYPGQVVRKVIDLSSKEVFTEGMFNEFVEFPQVSPIVSATQHRFGYGVSYSTPAAVNHEFFDCLAKLDFDKKEIEKIYFGPSQYPSEPAFVPKENGNNEDDGYVLTLVYDAIRELNYLAVIDASQFEKGVIGKAYLNSSFPLTFHGTWVQNK